MKTVSDKSVLPKWLWRLFEVSQYVTTKGWQRKLQGKVCIRIGDNFQVKSLRQKWCATTGDTQWRPRSWWPLCGESSVQRSGPPTLCLPPSTITITIANCQYQYQNINNSVAPLSPPVQSSCPTLLLASSFLVLVFVLVLVQHWLVICNGI